ncbi:DUF3426 domain-containing protein [Marinospirillum sp.]|uniref:DUF3426 domain-containing protein n=1 Tax=Marinospirillum sp. TaxID=2183934 RepID=UPI00384B5854
MSQKKNVHLARCPHCGSAFEVSDEELELAFGAVRCGECMKIFNANFHRIDPPDATTEEAQEPDSQASAEKDPIPTLHDHYHQQDADEEDDGEEWLDEEMLAFEAELETALSDPDGAEEPEEQFPAEIPEAEEPDEASTDLLDEELVTESRDPQPRKQTRQKQKSQGYRKYLIALVVVLVASFAALGAWLLWSPPTPEHFQVDEVSISPSTSPRMMEIHFQLSNQSQETLAMPDLQVDLLNLSRQVIATQKVAANDIQTENQQLEAGKSQMLLVEVERPSTYVQHARVIPLTP